MASVSFEGAAAVGGSAYATFSEVPTDPRLFDAAYYLARYRDEFAGAGIFTEAQALQHWVEYGAAEGRQGSPTIPPSSDPTRDVYLGSGSATEAAAFVPSAEPPPHLKSSPGSEALTHPTVFDAAYYLERYRSEFAAHGIDTLAEAEEHWLKYGLAEGRRASPNFDVAYYLEANHDVRAAVSGNPVAALLHYLNHGIREGRRGVPVDPASFGNPGSPSTRDSALALSNTNLHFRGPDGVDLGPLDPSAPRSPWYVVQWNTQDVLTPETKGVRTDPQLGTAGAAYVSATSALAIYDDPSSPGTPIVELATSGGHNANYGGHNLFLETVLAPPVQMTPGARIELDYKISYAAIAKAAEIDSKNVAQIHLGMVLHNPKTGEVIFLQVEMFESNNNGSSRHIDGNPNDPADRGTHTGLYAESGRPGEDLRVAPAGWVHADVDVYGLLQRALSSPFAVIGGGTYTYKGLDPADWRLTSVYYGTETAGTGVLTTQVKNFDLSP